MGPLPHSAHPPSLADTGTSLTASPLPSAVPPAPARSVPPAPHRVGLHQLRTQDSGLPRGLLAVLTPRRRFHDAARSAGDRPPPRSRRHRSPPAAATAARTSPRSAPRSCRRHLGLTPPRLRVRLAPPAASLLAAAGGGRGVAYRWGRGLPLGGAGLAAGRGRSTAHGAGFRVRGRACVLALPRGG